MKITQQELLDAMVSFSEEREEELIRYLSGVRLPLPPDELKKLLSIPVD
ncbi:MAG: DUF3684 domain-containing protein [Aigarchaeota archaeon]|nr:DUF3684 domain-containing protein [Candidatus Pelearchaeum maunauluense]